MTMKKEEREGEEKKEEVEEDVLISSV